MREAFIRFIRKFIGTGWEKKLTVKSDWMGLTIAHKKHILVRYNYHRYFWTTTIGKDITEIKSHIILN